MSNRHIADSMRREVSAVAHEGKGLALVLIISVIYSSLVGAFLEAAGLSERASTLMAFLCLMPSLLGARWICQVFLKSVRRNPYRADANFPKTEIRKDEYVRTFLQANDEDGSRLEVAIPTRDYIQGLRTSH